MKKNQSIKCNVQTCQYNDCNWQECTLAQIKVSCTCNENKCSKKIETICDNFKEK